MNQEFKQDLEIELENLRRLVDEMRELLKKIKNEPDFITTRAAGSIIHDFYCGIEKIFERIALNIDGNLPQGEDWHTKLLLQMTQPLSKKRDEVLDHDSMQSLKELLRFRHLFRNIYGFELKWAKIKPLCLKLEEIYDRLKLKMEKFLKYFKE